MKEATTIIVIVLMISFSFLNLALNVSSASKNGTILAAYYLQDIRPEEIKWHNWSVLILEPEEVDHTSLSIAKASSDIVLAYLNVGYAEDWREYWSNISDKPWIHEPTEYEGEYYVEYWHQEWHNILLDLAYKYLDQGFEGIYLDNIDASEILNETRPSWLKGFDPGREIVNLVCYISNHIKDYKSDALVFVNIGGAYDLLYNNTFLNCIDGVLREELWRTISVGNTTVIQNEEETRNALQALDYAKSKGKTIVIADPAANGEEALWLCIEAEKHDFKIIPQPSNALDYSEPPPRGWCNKLPRRYKSIIDSHTATANEMVKKTAPNYYMLLSIFTVLVIIFIKKYIK